MGKLSHMLLLAALSEEMEELMEHHEKEMHHGEKHGYERGYGREAHGMAKHHDTPALSREVAGEWVAGMKNADGSAGAHWTMEQTTKVLDDRGLRFDPLEWWVTMNMVWSDYCKVGEKHGVHTVAFYADLAEAFLHDEDAQKGKLAKYYWHIADPK